MADTYFVYVYRDGAGNPVYFGQGIGVLRPGSHEAASHNAAFDAWLQAHSGQYRIEVVGPLRSKEMADAVETALISACKPAQAIALFNEHPGKSAYRFRPYGVPPAFASRIEHPLTEVELQTIARDVGPVMFVRINQEDFNDGPGRVGYDLAAPPSDEEIRARVEAWWQVKKFLPEWTDHPARSPALLVGVTGGIGSQQVIASAEVDRSAWAHAASMKDGLLKIPLRESGLDACGLRGRRIPREVNLRFNSFRHSQFRIFSTDGF